MLTMRRQRQSRGDEGFTLIELLVVMAITSIVAAVVTASIVATMRTTKLADDRITASIDLQRGIERVGRELRVAESMVLDPGGRFKDGVGVDVVTDGERWNYRYYLIDVGDEVAELREDVKRFELDGTLIEEREGLFIADVANLQTGTPLFTYYAVDPATSQLKELTCAAASYAGDEDDPVLVTEDCRDRHSTASQVRLQLEKLIPNQDPVRVETVLNIRSTRFETEEP